MTQKLVVDKSMSTHASHELFNCSPEITPGYLPRVPLRYLPLTKTFPHPVDLADRRPLCLDERPERAEP